MLLLFGLLSGLLTVFCYIPYIRDILRKKTHPERASWFIWTVLTCIGFFSQLAKGASSSLILFAAATLGELIVFLLAIRFGTGGFRKRDYLALTFAAIGLIAWYFTKEAAVALYIVIAVDATGSVLTIMKSYEKPETETMSTWIIASLSGLSAALSIGAFNITLLSYPVYIFLANATIVTAILLGRHKKTF